MTTTIRRHGAPAAHSARIGQAVAAAILAWILFATLGDLQTNGLHLMVLGVLRMALLAALLAFVARAGIRSRLARVGVVPRSRDGRPRTSSAVSGRRSPTA